MLTRTCISGKPVLRAIANLPILAPSLLPALALIHIGGIQGFLPSADSRAGAKCTEQPASETAHKARRTRAMVSTKFNASSVSASQRTA